MWDCESSKALSQSSLLAIWTWTLLRILGTTQSGPLLVALQSRLKYIKEKSFQSNFHGLFLEIDLASDKLGSKYEERKSQL